MANYIWNYVYRSSQNLEFQENIQKLHTKDCNLQITEYSDAIILPWRAGSYWGLGGIVDNRGEFVEGSKKTPQCEVASFFGGEYEYGFAEENDNEVVYMGPFMHHWGHFLVDCLTRAWWLTNKLRDDLSNAKIIYLNIANKDIDGVYLELLELLGVQENRIIRVTKPTKFRKVHLPDEAYIVGGYWTSDFKRIFTKITQEAFRRYEGEKYEKVFFSRGKWKLGRQKGEYGENEIRVTFENNGFKVIYPEQLSVIEQIAIIYSANEIVCPMGTVAHAVALFGNNLKKLIISNKFYLHVPHQMYLNELLNAEIIYIDDYYSKTPGIYWVGLNKNLMCFLQDHDYIIPYSRTHLCFSYIINGIRYQIKRGMVPIYKKAARVRSWLLKRKHYGK